jgi:D-alanyl-D-alanine dipeptidase
MSDSLPLSDPVIAGLPVHDRGEALVDVRTVPVLRVDPRLAEFHDGYVLLRTTVVDRLVIAQSLLPRGLRLLVVEGYRPPEAQQRHLDECCEDLRRGHPDWSEQSVQREAGWHCAPAGSAPHSTGAAVDLTLCSQAGVELPMGTRLHAGPVESNGASATAAVAIPAEARAHRSTLGQALIGAGLVNLPTAWWHWSYGDRYWCYRTRAEAAPYGPIRSGPGRSPWSSAVQIVATLLLRR